jgi:uncharacterized membrane protein YhaH (DUF805 family)
MHCNSTMDGFIEAFRRYAELDGRSSRSEFWWFAGMNTLFGIVAMMIDRGLFPEAKAGRGPVALLYALIVASPSLAVSVRRLHDSGQSGWWMLMSVVPLIGQLVLFGMFVHESDAGENEYGPEPRPHPALTA